MVINHPLSASSNHYNPWHPLCSIYMPNSLFLQYLSKFSLVYLLAWHPPLHTSYTSSPNHCLLFAAHAHTISACFAVVLRLCHHNFISCIICETTIYSQQLHYAKLSACICSTPQLQTSEQILSSYKATTLSFNSHGLVASAQQLL